MFLNLFIWLHWGLVAAQGILFSLRHLLVVACWIFSCDLQILSCSMWDLLP